jgi:RNA methyltransferase, TrmH family
MARCWLADGRCGRLGKPCASGRCGARAVRRLHERRWRDKLALFVAEGEDLVAAAAAAGIDAVELLVAGENVEPRLIAEVSTLGHPPRVLGIYRRADLPTGPLPDLGLALWHVADPGNVGTLVRCADALGPAFVALSSGCADPTGPKALRASAGAIFRVPQCGFDEAPGERIALVSRGGELLDRVELPRPLTFVLGAEREGLPEELVATWYKATIRIESTADSLNVAIAGAIALYDAQRRAG